MVPVSVVIITKNEADIIWRSINMARIITDDIVVIDNGSTDDTEQIALANGCRVFHKSWDGYGANKNKGNLYARYNWILSLDADELIDDEMIAALHGLDYGREHVVYDINFKTYFGHKLIRFGNWGRDHHIRLFNKKMVKWSELPVHETLLLPKNIMKRKLAGHIHHYSVKDHDECQSKGIHYASLSAKKYYNNGQRSNFVKQYLSPGFNFVKNYIFLLGFLDGREGWYIAINATNHTWLKYHYLHQLACADKRNNAYTNSKLVIEY